MVWPSPVHPAPATRRRLQLTSIPEFSSQLKGYESVLCQCHNCVSVIPLPFACPLPIACPLPVALPTSHRSPTPHCFTVTDSLQGNWSSRVIKRHPWFTFCFIPVIPLSVHGYEDVVCSICNFAQPLQNRQDVMAQMNGGGGMPLQNQPPPGPQGWGGGPPGGGQGQPKPQQNMQVYR